MKKPDLFGRAAESLYGNVGSVERKIRKPATPNNLYGRPSLIPGVEMPISDREEQIIRCTWKHAKEMQRRGLL